MISYNFELCIYCNLLTFWWFYRDSGCMKPLQDTLYICYLLSSSNLFYSLKDSLGPKSCGVSQISNILRAHALRGIKDACGGAVDGLEEEVYV